MLLTQYLTKDNFLLLLQICIALFFARATIYGVYYRFLHPYRHYPGPFWASVTSLWYYRAIRYGRGQDTQLELHKKYGRWVRITPDQIQIMEPAAMDPIVCYHTLLHLGSKLNRTIVWTKAYLYQSRGEFLSDEAYQLSAAVLALRGLVMTLPDHITISQFYECFNPHIAHRRGGFEEADEKIHMVRRRILAPLYTQASILEFEPCVDRLISMFYAQMERFATRNEVFDMSDWLRNYTFDVIGEIFYGRKGGFGFMRDGIDYNNWLMLMNTMVSPASAKSYIPLGFRTLVFFSELINPSTRIGAQGFFDVIKQSHIAVKERLADIEANEKLANEKKPQTNDMLSKLIGLVSDNPDPKSYFSKSSPHTSQA